MFRIPQPRVAEPIHCLSQFSGGTQRSDARTSLDEWNQIQRRQRERLPFDLFARLLSDIAHVEVLTDPPQAMRNPAR